MTAALAFMLPAEIKCACSRSLHSYANHEHDVGAMYMCLAVAGGDVRHHQASHANNGKPV